MSEVEKIRRKHERNEKKIEEKRAQEKTENDLKEVEDFLHRIKECMPGRQYFFNFFQSSQKSSEFTG